MKDQTTPRPWRINNEFNRIESMNGEFVCNIESDNNSNIEFIIKCINMHDELVEALKLAVSALNQIPNTKNSEFGTTYKLIPMLDKVISKAESEAINDK